MEKGDKYVRSIEYNYGNGKLRLELGKIVDNYRNDDLVYFENNNLIGSDIILFDRNLSIVFNIVAQKGRFVYISFGSLIDLEMLSAYKYWRIKEN